MSSLGLFNMNRLLLPIPFDCIDFKTQFIFSLCRCVLVCLDAGVQTGAGMCFSQRGKTKLSAEVCVPPWEIMYYKTREKRAVGCRDRDKPRTERGRERKGRRGGWIIIEAGVDCSSMAGKCHTLRQRLSRSKLAHSQIWGAEVLNHPGLGTRVDR